MPDAPVWKDALAAIQALLADLGGRGVIIGGVAVALLAEARVTQDVDAMLLAEPAEAAALLQAARRHDLVPRIADAAEFAVRSRVLLLTHGPSGINVDVSLGTLPFEAEAVKRARLVNVSGLDVRLPTREDLIIMKAIACRPRDIEDIRMLVEAQPQLDRKRIERWVREFAEALDMPALWDDIAALLGDPGR